MESEVQYLLRRGHVDAMGEQESVANYPVRAVFTLGKYLTKEENAESSGVSER